MSENNQVLQPNTSLQGGKYIVEKVLGQGGFGITYLVRHAVFKEKLAIKEFFLKDFCVRDKTTNGVRMFRQAPEAYNRLREKFKKEAIKLHHLNHPQIVHVSDVFDEYDTTYYVMNYVEGQTLRHYILNSSDSMDKDLASDLSHQLLEVLVYVHSKGLLHLDIKPDNIIIDSDYKLTLIDFGASKQVESTDSMTMTSTNSQFCFTPGYAPIEQVSGNKEMIGVWTDLYAVGATIFFMLTKQNPSLPVEGSLSHIKDEVWYVFLKKSLAHLPSERYQSAEDMYFCAPFNVERLYINKVLPTDSNHFFFDHSLFDSYRMFYTMGDPRFLRVNLLRWWNSDCDEEERKQRLNICYQLRDIAREEEGKVIDMKELLTMCYEHDHAMAEKLYFHWITEIEKEVAEMNEEEGNDEDDYVIYEDIDYKLSIIMGSIYEKGGYGIDKNLETAKDCYERAITNSGDDGLPWMYLSRLFNEQKKWQQAFNCALKAKRMGCSSVWDDYYDDTTRIEVAPCWADSELNWCPNPSVWLGCYYILGRGCSLDIDKAIEMFMSNVDLSEEEVDIVDDGDKIDSLFGLYYIYKNLKINEPAAKRIETILDKSFECCGEDDWREWYQDDLLINNN